MRNWERTLRRASYRGVSFWVDAEDFNGGKRLAVHEYAGGRHSYIEEMGLRTSNYEVTAYLVGDLSDVEGKALEMACQAEGPGRLVLPIDGGTMAYVEDFRRLREKDRTGYIAFGFRAIPMTNMVGASVGVGDVTLSVSTGFLSASISFGGLF
jgi:prophage DNA circulation protein